MLGRWAWEPRPSVKGSKLRQGCEGRTNPQMDEVLRAHEEIHRKIVRNYFPKPCDNQAETTPALTWLADSPTAPKD